MWAAIGWTAVGIGAVIVLWFTLGLDTLEHLVRDAVRIARGYQIARIQPILNAGIVQALDRAAYEIAALVKGRRRAEKTMWPDNILLEHGVVRESDSDR